MVVDNLRNGDVPVGRIRWRIGDRHDSHDQTQAVVPELQSKALIGKAEARGVRIEVLIGKAPEME